MTSTLAKKLYLGACALISIVSLVILIRGVLHGI
jgi:hypothetical protein